MLPVSPRTLVTSVALNFGVSESPVSIRPNVQSIYHFVAFGYIFEWSPALLKHLENPRTNVTGNLGNICRPSFWGIQVPGILPPEYSKYRQCSIFLIGFRNG